MDLLHSIADWLQSHARHILYFLGGLAAAASFFRNILTIIKLMIEIKLIRRARAMEDRHIRIATLQEALRYGHHPDSGGWNDRAKRFGLSPAFLVILVLLLLMSERLSMVFFYAAIVGWLTAGATAHLMERSARSQRGWAREQWEHLIRQNRA